MGKDQRGRMAGKVPVGSLESMAGWERKGQHLGMETWVPEVQLADVGPYLGQVHGAGKERKVHEVP